MPCELCGRNGETHVPDIPGVNVTVCNNTESCLLQYLKNQKNKTLVQLSNHDQWVIGRCKEWISRWTDLYGADKNAQIPIDFGIILAKTVLKLVETIDELEKNRV